MKETQTPKTFGTFHKILHWGMALIIISLLALGFYMSDLSNGPSKFQLYGLHKSFGIIFFILVAIRFFWRITHPVPQLPNSIKGFHRIASHLSVWTLYGAMVLMPITGYVMSSAGGYPVDIFGLIPIPLIVNKNPQIGSLAYEMHEVLALITVALIVTHVLASLYHHFILKNNILARMMPKF